MAGVDHRSAHRESRYFRRLPITVGASLPIIADGGHDQARIDAPQRLIVHPQRRHHPRAETLNERVRVLHQIENNLPPALRLEIQRHGTLAQVGVHEQPAPLEARLILVERRHIPRRIADHRPLNLDDVRPVVGKAARSERPRRVPREIDHANTRQSGNVAVESRLLDLPCWLVIDSPPILPYGCRIMALGGVLGKWAGPGL